MNRPIRLCARSFLDVAAAAGILGREEYYGLGVAVGDFNNDSWPDIYVANNSCPSFLFLNLGNGRFGDVSAVSGPGILEDRSSRGAAFGDQDNDGDIDTVVANLDDMSSILRDDGGNSLNWPTVELRGTRSNRFGRSYF